MVVESGYLEPGECRVHGTGLESVLPIILYNRNAVAMRGNPANAIWPDPTFQASRAQHKTSGTTVGVEHDVSTLDVSKRRTKVLSSKVIGMQGHD